MVDINPDDTRSKYAPRETNLVDAVAETKRIADQQMRSNPMKDARIDSGLTKWTGNYGGDLAWFGEFFPADQNQFDVYGNMKPQRGISFVRDDPNHASAFAMYDFNPQTGIPLRQRIYLHDADGKPILYEGYNGGTAYPDSPIVMYQRESFENPAATWTSDRVAYSGEGHMKGTRLDFNGAYTLTVAGDTISSFLRVSGGGVTINTATSAVTGSQNIAYSLDVKTIWDVSDYVNVEWHMWRSAGSGSFLPRIYRCRSYSNFSS